MDVFGVYIQNKPLSNLDLLFYAYKLKIPNFRGVYMRDTLPQTPKKVECGIMNFNTKDQPGSHWVCWSKNKDRIYFDSFGQITPIEIQKYLKKKSEYGCGVIMRNTDIIQPINTVVCGHLCLFVLKALGEDWSFQKTLDYLNGYSQTHWEAPKTI